MEPKYVEDPFEDGATEFGVRRPKWMTPKTEFERKVLGVFGMKYYPRKEVGGRDMYSRLSLIGKSLVPLASGLDAVYPNEWIDCVLDWAKGKKLTGHTGLKAFLSALEDVDWRSRFITEWRSKNPDYTGRPVSNQDFGEFVIRRPK